jgi:hypothetical protein
MYTKETIKWFNILIKERISKLIFLTQSEGKYKLVCEGSDKYIIFNKIEMRFLSENFYPYYTTWDGTKEGLILPLNKEIPSPSHMNNGVKIIEKIDQGYKINYDIFGFIYWTLNRVEEYKNNKYDKHQRFKIEETYSMKNGYYERPVVDEWFDILKQITKKLWNDIEINKKNFTLWVSHDVDRPSRYSFTTIPQLIRRMGGDIVKNRNIKNAIMGPLIRNYPSFEINRLDPWNKFEWLMSISEKYNLKSTFFFMTGKTDNKYDGDYEITDERINYLIKLIMERKHEIGLHPSYNSYLSKDKLINESQKFINECGKYNNIDKWGTRMHYLRWKQPETLELLDSIGVTYDSSMAFEQNTGFRCGTSHEYTAFSCLNDRILKIRVRPLIVMEEQITENMGLGLGEKAYDKFIEMKDICRKFNGEYSMLWHNSYLDNREKKELYEQVIKN